MDNAFISCEQETCALKPFFWGGRGGEGAGRGPGISVSTLHCSNWRPGRVLQKTATKTRGYPQTDKSSVFFWAIAGTCNGEQVCNC